MASQTAFTWSDLVVVVPLGPVATLQVANSTQQPDAEGIEGSSFDPAPTQSIEYFAPHLRGDRFRLRDLVFRANSRLTTWQPVQQRL
jgi:hypothetical protein